VFEKPELHFLARAGAFSLLVGTAGLGCSSEHAIPPEGRAAASAGEGARDGSSSEPESAEGEAGSNENSAPAAEVDPVPDSVQDRFPAAQRLVVFGDVHGDLNATIAALEIAGAIDEERNWSGGELVLVQTGDQLDRGDEEPEILALFEQLQTQASEAGGAFHVLNGNHEIMNAMTDLRYVTPEGFTDYANTDVSGLPAEVRDQMPSKVQGRVAAFMPGSSLARQFARRPIVLVVGDTVFVHGGLTPRWAEYGIEQINDEASDYLRGDRSERPEALTAQDGPIWSRHFSDAPDAQDCADLQRSLEIVGAKRMVVGHTVIMEGIRSACEDRVWMVDVGMASHYGGKAAALEITSAGVEVLSR
jgi:hypothetical protein